jgi:hypothetical protein
LLQFDSGATGAIGTGLVIGNNAGSNGTLQIGGISGSTVVNTTGMTIGFSNAATGTLTTSSTNTTLNNNGDVNIARAAGATGIVRVNMGSTWNQSGGSIFVGGTNSGAGGFGLLEVGGNINITGASNGITIRGTGAAPNNSLLSLGAGIISTPRFTRDPNGIFDFQGGTLQINGGPLMLNQPSFTLDGNLAGPTLTFNGLGSVFESSSMNLIVAASRRGNFNVLAGAQPTLGSLAVGSATGGTGAVNISGPGSILTANAPPTSAATAAPDP